jgi:hypothetical protein
MPRHVSLSTDAMLLQPCRKIRRIQGNVSYGSYLDHGGMFTGHREQPVIHFGTGIGTDGIVPVYN